MADVDSTRDDSARMISTADSARRLRDAIQQSDLRLQPFRRARRDFLSQYGGPHYGKGDSLRTNRETAGPQPNPEPLNTLFSTASILVPHLVFRNPHAYVTTAVKPLEFQAESLALAMDHLIKEIDLVTTLRSVVTDALFSCGIVKTGICPGGYVEGFEEPEGYLHDIGQPFCDAVSLDDYVVDPNARRREHAAFEGNYYRLPMEYIMESDLFKNKDSLVSVQEARDELASEISQGNAQRMRINEFTGYVDLIDLWLPHENVIVTIPAEKCGPPVYLREVEWEGPERGPYEMLGFNWMPDNLLPVSPVSVWYDLHVALNIMARKAARQAERQKVVGVYSAINAEDAENIRSANDGELVAVKDPSAVKELTLGGQNNKVMEYIPFLQANISQMAGNTDIIGGLGSKSPTATQDQMLMEGASARLDDMREQVQVFGKHILNKLAWYLWTDPLIEIPLVKREQGVDLDYTFSAEEKEGDLLDYSIDIEPQSMVHRSPESDYQKLIEFISGPLMAMAQLGVAVGQVLDPQKVMDAAAKALNIDNADEWFAPAPPQGTGAMPDGTMGGQVQDTGGAGAGGTPASPYGTQPETTPQPSENVAAAI